MIPRRFRDTNGTFELTLPAGWQTEPDGEGGLLLYREDGCGLLHLMPFERDPFEDLDPAEELYAFLADQEIELEEDEVDDVTLPIGSLAICEYIADDEDEEITYWLVGVATAPGQLLFASYSCAAGEEDAESGAVREILSSLSFDTPSSPG
jgi:hypothetical protein